MLHFNVGDTVEVNDMNGIYTVISISMVSLHLVDLILQKGNVKYFVRRRKFQVKKYEW